MLFNRFPFKSYGRFRVELLTFVLWIDSVMFSAYDAEHSFSFLKEEPMIAVFFTVGKGIVGDPLMLEAIFSFHSLLIFFTQSNPFVCLAAVKAVDFTGFVRVLENLESPGILLWHFPGLESPGKRPLVLESSGNLLNLTKKYEVYERQ